MAWASILDISVRYTSEKPRVSILLQIRDFANIINNRGGDFRLLIRLLSPDNGRSGEEEFLDSA